METGPRIVPVRVALEDREKKTEKIEEKPEKEKEKESNDGYEENFKQFELEVERVGHRYVINRHKTASDFSEIKKVLGKNLKSSLEDMPDMEYLRSQLREALQAFIAHQIEKMNRADLTPKEIDVTVKNLTKSVKINEGVKLFELKTAIETSFFRDPEAMTKKIDKFIDWHRAQMGEGELPADVPNSEEKPPDSPSWKKEYMESIAARSDISANFADPSEALYLMALAQRCASLSGERKSLKKIKDPNEHAKGRLAEVDMTLGEIKEELLEKKSPVEKVDKVASEVYGKYGEEFDNLEIISRLHMLDMAEQGRKIRDGSIESPGSEEIISRLEAQLSKSDKRIERGMSLRKMHDLIFVDIFSKMARDFFRDSKEIKKLPDLENYGASAYLKSNKKSEIGKIYDRLTFLFRGKSEIKPKKDESMGKWLKRILPKVIEAKRVTSL